ncbi:MAG TPA: S53 family peptidase [Candidatus Eisenbacteria bacterium]|nr:S53 family peptidase [Candidatus Eisenbacteria bacterium]
MKSSLRLLRATAVTILAIAFLFFFTASHGVAQSQEAVFNGHRIIIPESSIPQPGRHHTNYFFVDSDQPAAQPSSGVETPGSLACVYQLVSGPAGCPVATSTAVPTGGWGAIAIVDAGYYPTAAQDLAAFSSYYGIPPADLTVTWPGTKRPPVYSGWLVEEALDIEWAHAMAPQAKMYLVVSDLKNTDPTWAAVQLAAQLVAQAGGGVVSMSWGDPEVSQELSWDRYFTTKGVVFFAASGDSGLDVSIYPGASPNVVSVGGTYFNRDSNGNFVNEVYYSGGGGGDLSPYEPRPAYQNGVANVVGTHRGYPDVASDFCCAPIYLEGNWFSVGGTSWASPTFAGIVNAAGHKAKTSVIELTALYKELANQTLYSERFNDITQGASQCTIGFDECTGIGSPKTYAGK